MLFFFLDRFGNIPYGAIRGFRAPFLIFIENMFKALYISKFTYDLSWPAIYVVSWAWPYVPLHPGLQVNSVLPYPGLWEVPNVNLMNKDHTTCGSVMDACEVNGNETVWYDILVRNFHYHYDTNRAPFGMHMHPSYFSWGPYGWPHERRQEISQVCPRFGRCLDFDGFPSGCVDERSPRYCATEKFSTTDSSLPRCTDSTANDCHYTMPQDFYMKTCTECPPHFPSPTNPDGN